ncbi:MAG: hypothetical protein RLZZ149_1170 [Pseudomonadota bacterium]
MKWLYLLPLIVLTLMINPSDASANPTNTACASVLSHTFLRLQDEVPQNLCQYQGKVIMVVNTASFCGFTSQYEGLEKIYARYKDKGFVILGFPSNDFGQQEPGSNKEIAEFCKNTYDVKFPMFAKSSVSKTGTTPKWNFYKYLIDRNGNIIESYNSLTKPDSKSMTSEIEKLLKGKSS